MNDDLKRPMHWDLCRRLEFEHRNRGYENVPSKVQESKYCKVLWDFNIETRGVMNSRKYN